MPDLNISRAFIVSLQDGSKYTLVPGLNRGVPQAVADSPVIQYIRVPEDASAEMAQPVPDARGVGELVQARAAAEEAAERLRTEVGRLTLAWSEADIRARRAEAHIDDLKGQLAQATSSGVVSQDVFDDMQRQRDEAHARVAELERGVDKAQDKVEGLTEEFQQKASPVPATVPIETPSAPPPDESPEESEDEKVGDYTVRRRGKKYVVIKLDAENNTIETVDSFDSKSEAEAKAESLKAAL